MKEKVLIVGGVAGGASAAARLRRLDENKEIIIFERGDYISFANCGLPYYIGEVIEDRDSLLLQTPNSFRKRFNIDVRVKSEVIGIDTENKKATVKDRKTNIIYKEEYDKLILSPGAKPIIPSIEGINSNKVFFVRNIPDADEIKNYIKENHVQKVVIMGGGYIGIEVAENLKKLGLDVTIIEMSKQILSQLDYEISLMVEKHIVDNKVELLLNTKLLNIEDNGRNLNLILSNKEISVDMLIVTVGVRPDTAFLNDTDIKRNPNGAIVVNEYLETTKKDIYAIGDAIEVTNFITEMKTMMPLAGIANKQGHIVADNICGINSTYKGTQGTSILKVFDLAVATTGISEKNALMFGLNYEKVFTYSSDHASYYPDSKTILIKTIFENKTGKILGAELIGQSGVDKRADVIATTIRFKGTAKDLQELELSYAPPFASAKDPVNVVGNVIDNIIEKRVNIFHWHDIEELQKKDDVILLDIRTKQEYDNGHIPGFINIDLNELRSRIDEIDKSKKIYVTCQVGLRGYLACRILSQKGYNCADLSGGYQLYNSIINNKEIVEGQELQNINN